MTQPRIPLPVPNEDTQPFWEGIRRGELLIQRCADCGTYRHYPRPACFNCTSLRVAWVKASGKGHVYSFIIAHQAFLPAFRERTPYNLVLVELDDIPGVRMASNLINSSLEDIHIGMPVEIAYESVTEEATIYKFRPRPA